MAVKIQSNTITCRHEKKMVKFCKAQKSDNFTNKPCHIMKRIVHNFSSYNLSQEEINGLSYGLDHHVPTNINKNSIVTKFELFFQNLLKDISNIPETELSRIKTKLCNTCKKCCNTKVPYAQRKIISNLSKQNIDY